jgi:hypothetical protein
MKNTDKKQALLDYLSKHRIINDKYRYSNIRSFPFVTEGVLGFAELAECFWLLDIIGSYQKNPNLNKTFQGWSLQVDLQNKTAVVYGCNDTEVIITQEIEYTNFPLEEINLFLYKGLLMLPLEHYSESMF